VVEDSARLADDITKLEFDSLEIGIDTLAAFVLKRVQQKITWCNIYFPISYLRFQIFTGPRRVRKWALEVRL